MLILSGFAGVVTILPQESEGAEPTMSSSYTSSSPTIDGELSGSEWDDAATKSIMDDGIFYPYEAGSSSTTVDIVTQVMNDGENLYIAIELSGDERNMSDFFMISFDNNNDGVSQDGEDFKAISQTMGYVDNNQRQPNPRDEGDNSYGGTQDGQGAINYKSGTQTYIVESKIPLDSGDEFDISMEPGDTVGFSIIYIDQYEEDTIIYGWPSHNPDDASNWADLEIAEEGGGNGDSSDD